MVKNIDFNVFENKMLDLGAQISTNRELSKILLNMQYYDFSKTEIEELTRIINQQMEKTSENYNEIARALNI
ncbi:MAG: hypothetical protein ACI4SM_04960 [Candidatus Gastranaerophilaceae bacterium]